MGPDGSTGTNLQISEQNHFCVDRFAAAVRGLLRTRGSWGRNSQLVVVHLASRVGVGLVFLRGAPRGASVDWTSSVSYLCAGCQVTPRQEEIAMNLLRSEVVEWLLTDPDQIRDAILRIRSRQASAEEASAADVSEPEMPSEPQSGSDS